MSARRFAREDAAKREAARAQFNPVHHAAQRILDAKGVAHFSYTDSKGKTSTRRVAVEDVTDEHLRGTDLDARAFRSFRLDRIEAIDSSVRVQAGELAKLIAATLLARQGDVLTEELAHDRATEIARTLVGIEVMP